MTGPLLQLWALLRLRWQMARAPGLRLAIVLGAMLVGYLLHLIVMSASTIDAPVLAAAIQITPSAFLGFSGLALIAPLTAGGGNEVVPPDQLLAFPVRPSTQFLGGLMLAPLNLVWMLQLLVLVALTAYLTIGGSFALGALTTGVFVVAITVFGQALAWTVVGLRQTRRGRRIVTAIGLALLGTVVAVVRAGVAGTALDASPTRRVVLAVISGGAGGGQDWLPVTAALVAAAVTSTWLGVRACRWALARPGDAGSGRRSEPVRRRAPKASALRELIAVDRASVWRAPALRRGGLVLVVLPGLVAAGIAVPWQSLVVLPGLVAAGAGLLFGINAFCLDGSGAVWLASLPHEPRLVARAKTIVLTETVLGAVVIAAVAGSLRSPGSPTAAEAVAIVATGLACTATVVASCLRSSVRHPHRAELRGPRDAVAPPGALAMASVRLATPTAFAGVIIASAAGTGTWWLPLGLAVPVILAAGLSLNRSLRRYADPVVRARVVQAVAAG